MEERVTFVSGGLKLAGVLHVPDTRTRERRPAFLVLHGFGSSKDSGGSVASARLFAELGYAALRFDMRGCGQSEGVRGRVICLEQVEDALKYFSGSIALELPERQGDCCSTRAQRVGWLRVERAGGSDPDAVEDQR